jgi:hypothetical protein
MSEPVPFSERDDEDSVDDLLAMLADAVTDTDSPQDMVHELVNNVFESTDQIAVLGNFVFIGEIVDEEGLSRLMVVTSDNLPEWIARGMMSTAEDYIMGGPLE